MLSDPDNCDSDLEDIESRLYSQVFHSHLDESEQNISQIEMEHNNESQDDSNLGDLRNHLNSLKHVNNKRYFKEPNSYSNGQVHNNLFGNRYVSQGNPVPLNLPSNNQQNAYSQFFPMNIPVQNFFIISPNVPLPNVSLNPAPSAQIPNQISRFPPPPKLSKTQKRKRAKEKRKNELALIKAATNDAEVFKNLSIGDRKKVLHYQKLERIRLKKKERKKQEEREKLMVKYNEEIDKKLLENGEIANNDEVQDLTEGQKTVFIDGDKNFNSDVIYVPTVPQIISISESDSDDCEIVGNIKTPVNLDSGAAVDVKNLNMIYDLDGLEWENEDIKVNAVENCNDDDVVFIEPEPIQENVIDLDSEPETNVRNSSDIETASHSSITQELRPPLSTPTKQGISLRHQREQTSTPESFNDFLENSIDSRQNFSNSSDTKAKPFNEVCGSESSATSDLSLSTRNNVFNEVEFETPSKELFSDGNLQTFSDFITPKRLVSNVEEEVERSESSSESEQGGESKKKKRRRLPSLSHIEPQEVPSLTDSTKVTGKKKKKKKSKDGSESENKNTDNDAGQTEFENAETPMKRKKKKKNKGDCLETSEVEQSKENLEETESTEATKQKNKRSVTTEDSLEVAEPENVEDNNGENIESGSTPGKLKKRKKKKWKVDSNESINRSINEEDATENNAESDLDTENDQSLLKDGLGSNKKIKKRKHAEKQSVSEDIDENAYDETIIANEDDDESALNESCSDISKKKSKKKKKGKRKDSENKDEAAHECNENEAEEPKDVENDDFEIEERPQIDESCESPAKKKKKKRKNERDSSNELEQCYACNEESTEPGIETVSSIVENEDNILSRGALDNSVVIVENCNDDHSSSDIELIETVHDLVVIDDDDEGNIDGCNEETIKVDLDTNIEDKNESSTTTKQSSVVKPDPRRFASLWSEDPAIFYKNLYEDSKKFDMNESRRNMSNDREKWKLLPDDKYKFRTSRPRCKRCRGVGHTFKVCRKPQLLICKLCSGLGHLSNFCPSALCTQCGARTILTTTWCQRCSYMRYEYCSICGQMGHTNYYCPDTWRRYHLTTEEGPIVRPTKETSLRPAKDQWCSGCARKGHFEYTCRYFNREHAPTLPGIVDYTDLYGFPLNSNNSVNQNSNNDVNQSSNDKVDAGRINQANFNGSNNVRTEINQNTNPFYKQTVKCTPNLVIEIFKPYFSCFKNSLQIDDTIEIQVYNTIRAKKKLDIVGPKPKVLSIKKLIRQYNPKILKQYNCTRINADISGCMSLVGTISDDPIQLLNKLKPFLENPGNRDFVRLNVVLFGQLELEEGGEHLQFLKAYMKMAQKNAHLTPDNYRAVVMSHRYVFMLKRSYEEYLAIIENGKKSNPLLCHAR